MFGIPEKDIQKMREAAQKIADEVDFDFDSYISESHENVFKRKLTAIKVLLDIMEEHPEFRNEHLLDVMKSDLESMIVDGEEKSSKGTA